MRNPLLSFLLITLLASFAMPVSAQGGPGGLPPCTPEDLVAVEAAFGPYFEALLGLQSRVQAVDPTGLPQLIGEANGLQASWWSQYAPALPSCSLAREVALAAGRALDEYLIALALLSGGYQVEANGHLQQASVLMEQLRTLEGQLESGAAGLYRVAFVRDDDVLNVRSGPGVDNPVVGELAYDAVGVMITGQGQAVGPSLWVPIQHGGVSGWVNRYYLTEQVSTAAFCADSRPLGLAAALREAVSKRDGAALAALVHPRRGLLIRHEWWNPEVRLSQDEVAAVFTDSTRRSWGVQDGSGLPIEGTVAEVILPLLVQDLLPASVIACGELVGGGTAGLLQLPPEYQAVHFYALHRPPPDAENTFDWGTWAVGIEYWEGQPALSFLVHYHWEI